MQRTDQPKKAELEGSAFTPLYGFALDDVLCIQEERMVSKDNTVKYKGHTLQLTSDSTRLHYAKSTVRVHEYPDGSLALFHGPRKVNAMLLEEKDNKEDDLPDAFIAFVPSSDWDKTEGEAVTPPSLDLGNHRGAQVTRQCCPILRTAKHISARP